MASAGERTVLCEFLEQGALTGAGEIDPNPGSWPVWHRAWAKTQGLRGGEVIAAREPQASTVVQFFFDYPDVINPLGGGKSLVERMVIRTPDHDNALYNIDAIFPEEVSRREVRVVATKTRLAVA